MEEDARGYEALAGMSVLQRQRSPDVECSLGTETRMSRARGMLQQRSAEEGWKKACIVTGT